MTKNCPTVCKKSIGVDRHACPDHQAHHNRAFGPYPPGDHAKRQRTEKGHKLHHQDQLNQRIRAHAQLFAAKLGGHGDHGLDAVVVEQIGDQKEQGLGIARQLAQGTAQLFEANSEIAFASWQLLARLAVDQGRQRDEGKERPPDPCGRQADPHCVRAAHAQAVVRP